LASDLILPQDKWAIHNQYLANLIRRYLGDLVTKSKATKLQSDFKKAPSIYPNSIEEVGFS